MLVELSLEMMSDDSRGKENVAAGDSTGTGAA